MLAAFFATASPLRAQSATTSIIALTGQAAPEPNSVYDESFGLISTAAVLNDDGIVAFLSFVEYGAATSVRALISGNATSKFDLVHVGESTSAGVFDELQTPSLTLGGLLAFNGDRTGAGQRDGIFRVSTGGVLSTVIEVGSPLPDGNGTFASAPNRIPLINSSGQTAFAANLAGTTGGTADDTAILRGNASGVGVAVVAREGQDAPGGGKFASLFTAATRPEISATGQVAFSAALTGAPAAEGVFLGDGTTLTEVARRGQLLSDGSTLGDIGSAGPQINASGVVAFQASTTEVGAPQIILRGTASGLTRIAKSGDPLPGGVGNISSIRDDVELNDLGQVAFLADTGAGGNALLRGDGTAGSLIMPVRAGDLLADGTAIFGLQQFALNDLGALAFKASLNSNTSVGLFFFDPAFGIREVIRTGTPFLGSTVSDLYFAGTTISGTVPDELSGLNNNGQVAYRFQLADGRDGVALWTVPEPSAVSLLALSTIAILSRRGKPIATALGKKLERN